jgi:hypothetical protein
MFQDRVNTTREKPIYVFFHTPKAVLVSFSSFLTHDTQPNRSATSGFVFRSSYVEVLIAHLYANNSHVFSMGHSCWLATFDAPHRRLSKTRIVAMSYHHTCIVSVERMACDIPVAEIF